MNRCGGVDGCCVASVGISGSEQGLMNRSGGTMVGVLRALAGQARSEGHWEPDGSIADGARWVLSAIAQVLPLLLWRRVHEIGTRARQP